MATKSKTATPSDTDKLIAALHQQLQEQAQRLAALEAVAHTEHTISPEALEHLADVTIARIVSKINQLLQPAQQQEASSIEE